MDKEKQFKVTRKKLGKEGRIENRKKGNPVIWLHGDFMGVTEEYTDMPYLPDENGNNYFEYGFNDLLSDVKEGFLKFTAKAIRIFGSGSKVVAKVRLEQIKSEPGRHFELFKEVSKENPIFPKHLKEQKVVSLEDIKVAKENQEVLTSAVLNADRQMNITQSGMIEEIISVDLPESWVGDSSSMGGKQKTLTNGTVSSYAETDFQNTYERDK